MSSTLLLQNVVTSLTRTDEHDGLNIFLDFKDLYVDLYTDQPLIKPNNEADNKVYDFNDINTQTNFWKFVKKGNKHLFLAGHKGVGKSLMMEGLKLLTYSHNEENEDKSLCLYIDGKKLFHIFKSAEKIIIDQVDSDKKIRTPDEKEIEKSKKLNKFLTESAQKIFFAVFLDKTISTLVNFASDDNSLEGNMFAGLPKDLARIAQEYINNKNGDLTFDAENTDIIDIVEGGFFLKYKEKSDIKFSLNSMSTDDIEIIQRSIFDSFNKFNIKTVYVCIDDLSLIPQIAEEIIIKTSIDIGKFAKNLANNDITACFRYGIYYGSQFSLGRNIFSDNAINSFCIILNPYENNEGNIQSFQRNGDRIYSKYCLKILEKHIKKSGSQAQWNHLFDNDEENESFGDTIKDIIYYASSGLPRNIGFFLQATFKRYNEFPERIPFTKKTLKEGSKEINILTQDLFPRKNSKAISIKDNLFLEQIQERSNYLFFLREFSNTLHEQCNTNKNELDGSGSGNFFEDSRNKVSIGLDKYKNIFCSSFIIKKDGLHNIFDMLANTGQVMRRFQHQGQKGVNDRYIVYSLSYSHCQQTGLDWDVEFEPEKAREGQIQEKINAIHKGILETVTELSKSCGCEKEIESLLKQQQQQGWFI